MSKRDWHWIGSVMSIYNVCFPGCCLILDDGTACFGICMSICDFMVDNGQKGKDLCDAFCTSEVTSNRNLWENVVLNFISDPIPKFTWLSYYLLISMSELISFDKGKQLLWLEILYSLKSSWYVPTSLIISLN